MPKETYLQRRKDIDQKNPATISPISTFEPQKLYWMKLPERHQAQSPNMLSHRWLPFISAGPVAEQTLKKKHEGSKINTHNCKEVLLILMGLMGVHLHLKTPLLFARLLNEMFMEKSSWIPSTNTRLIIHNRRVNFIACSERPPKSKTSVARRGPHSST